MKKIYILILFMGSLLHAGAQSVSTFDDLTLDPESYWNGSDLSGGFASGDAFFVNTYNDTWDVWSGFVYSNMTDVNTEGFANQYSAYTGSGYGGSANYAIGNTYSHAMIKLTGAALGSVVQGVYVTNATYAALSIMNGDDFGKKFGGDTGDDPDWFKLSISGYSGGVAIADSVHFYLADFRFADNLQDYIVDTWEWVDLTGLGNVDSLTFSLSSSDVGDSGMNTPAYFAIDNFNDVPAGIFKSAPLASFTVFPNPASDIVYIDANKMHGNISVTVSDLNGQEMFSRENVFGLFPLPVDQLQKGVYVIRVQSPDGTSVAKFIRQ